MFLASLPSWQPHPEVWLLVAGVIALGVYTSRVIQPKAVAAGLPPISAKQRLWFTLGVIVLWGSSEWPMHDVAEQRLYAVHMVQHALLTLVAAPLFLMATPEWLVRLMLREGPVYRFIRFWGRSLPSLIAYNLLLVLTHSAWIVNTSVSNGPFHYAVHVLIVVSALLVWMPVCGPLPELKISPPFQMAHIFLMSVIPTIPAAFLTTAEGVIYEGYDTVEKMFNWDVVEDQQLAGVVMKVITGSYLWVLIAIIFFRWMLRSRTHRAGHFRGKLVTNDGRILTPDVGVETEVDRRLQEAKVPDRSSDESLTYDEVARAFEQSPPPPER